MLEMEVMEVITWEMEVLEMTVSSIYYPVSAILTPTYSVAHNDCSGSLHLDCRFLSCVPHVSYTV